MRRLIWVCATGIILAGCSNIARQGFATQQELMFCRNNDGKPLTQDEFVRDIYACLEQSKALDREYTQDKEDMVLLGDPLFRKCMESRGYLYFLTEPSKRKDDR